MEIRHRGDRAVDHAQVRADLVGAAFLEGVAGGAALGESLALRRIGRGDERREAAPHAACGGGRRGRCGRLLRRSRLSCGRCGSVAGAAGSPVSACATCCSAAGAAASAGAAGCRPGPAFGRLLFGGRLDRLGGLLRCLSAGRLGRGLLDRRDLRHRALLVGGGGVDRAERALRLAHLRIRAAFARRFARHGGNLLAAGSRALLLRWSGLLRRCGCSAGAAACCSGAAAG